MQRELSSQAENYLARGKSRRIWQKLVSVLACVVVFCTTYALILPAITMEKAYCGYEEHTHDDSCYEQIAVESNGKLTCSLESLDADIVIHSHDSSCYDSENSLICNLREQSLHSHGEDCYIVEETEGHTHDDDCYKIVRGKLTCTKEEAEAHTHVDTCWDSEQNLICTIEEAEGHAHGDACYEQKKVLTCELSESSGESKKTLVCEKEEIVLHTHSSECGGEDVCDKPVVVEHTHTDACTAGTTKHGELICEKEEHTHNEGCYANLSADLETEAEWEETLPENLSGEWSDDLIAVAKSQLGYEESTENYQISDNGTKKGYTRYGHWYGDKYGDWCAMFVSFCLNYAEVDIVKMPQDANCANWIETLSKEEYNLYHAVSEEEPYEPKVGDLIFFEWGDDDDTADHVGIVTEIIPATEEEPEKIKTIEGNSSDQVKENTYELADESILGYGELPAQEYTCGIVGHAHTKVCKDDAGNLICEKEEHIHTEECAKTPLTEDEQKEVDEVIAMIDALPTADEIDAKLLEYEDAEDWDGYEAYYTEVGQGGRAAYEAYEDLSDNQKLYVTNIDKLMEWSYIWSAVTLIEDVSGINSADPTPTWYTSTKDFIELNLYDYIYGINSNWESDQKYPGFQWNGGAYAKSDYKYLYSTADDGIPDYVTDRNYIDSIDFGNSMITNFAYAGSNYAKSTTSTSVGKLYDYDSASNTGKINWLWYDGSDYGTTTNRPVGISTGYESLSNTLLNGYPALSDGTSLAYLFGGESKAYVIKKNTESIDGLFQQDAESGEYEYNSRINHAQYSNNFFTLYDQIITPNFITYPFGNFLPMNTITDNTQATQVGAFNNEGGVKSYVEGIIADLNEAIDRDDDGNGTEADYGDTSRKQLITMLQEYRENWTLYPTSAGTKWTNLSAANAIRDYFLGDSSGNGDAPSSELDFLTQAHLDNMYNIDWDVATNFFFGMEMKMNFMMPKEGMTGNDTNGDGESDYPMKFYFTGDDDVWVYVDEKLTLDLTGIHRHVGGAIDFVNGLVHYYELDVENGGDVSSTPYATYGFEEIFPASSLITKSETRPNDSSIAAADKDLRGTAIQTFENYSTHSFNFYYMERGSGSSVCRLNFNFPLIQKNAITVTKENESDDETIEILGNPDYYFNIVTPNNELFVGPNSVTGVTTYKVLDSNGNYILDDQGEHKLYTVDQYGIFTLKAGQSAVFEDIDENEGKYYVQELIKAEDEKQYQKEVTVNGEPSRYNEIIYWQNRTYFSDADNDDTTGPYGYVWYGHSGYDKDASASHTFYFKAENGVVTDKLGQLSITKQVKSVETVPTETFKMYVTLDEVPLKVGSTYNIGTTSKTVTEEGCIEIRVGQTAVISNILSGTEFVVTEDSEAAGDYTVDYSVTGIDKADITNDDGTNISGIVRTSAEVSVTVTNAGDGTSVVISGTKSIPNSDGGDYTFKFLLEEVTAATGKNAVEDGECITSSVHTKDSKWPSFEFALNYSDSDVGTHYYRITEVPNDDENTSAFEYDSSIYVVEVVVSKAADNTLSARVNKIYINDGAETANSIAFTNTLLSSLTISKVVEGTENKTQEYQFGILLSDANGPVTGTYMAEKQDGIVLNVSFDEKGEIYKVNDEQINYISLKADESITISGIPYGTSWKVTELAETDEAIDYIVSWETDTKASPDGEDSPIAEGKVVNGDNSVKFTNTAAYVLPESGGIGTNPYIIGGLMAVSLSILLLLYINNKRRKEEYESS